MKSLAQAAQEHQRELWKAAVAHSEGEFRVKRPWKIGLCVMIFSEVEVVGDVLTVDRVAEQLADKATVTLHTAPVAHRRWVQRRSDPKNPESPLEWVEVVYGPVDTLNADSPWAWQLKR